MDGMPVLRVELNGLKTTVEAAILDRQKELVAFTQHALERSLAQLTPETLQKVIAEAVHLAAITAIDEALNELVSEAVHKFFTEGEGARAVTEAIRKQFNLGKG